MPLRSRLENKSRKGIHKKNLMSFGPKGLQVRWNKVALLINDVSEGRLILQAALNKMLRKKHKWEQMGQKCAARVVKGVRPLGMWI